jgi:hypothetical protein
VDLSGSQATTPVFPQTPCRAERPLLPADLDGYDPLVILTAAMTSNGQKRKQDRRPRANLFLAEPPEVIR